MKKSVKIILSLAIIIVLAAGGYVGNMFGLFNQGNYGNYTPDSNEAISSPINGKTVIFLGSSVTFGYGSLGTSFVEYLEEADGIIPVKEAVSGTTLADIKKNSYVSRLKTVDTAITADAFVCQLSTNDATKNIPLGTLSTGTDSASFDTSTVIGAIEYIINYVNNTWHCPVIFYTNTRYENDNYQKMVDALSEISGKYDITVIDLWNNEELNNISDEKRSLYMVDSIHPTRAGYSEWWLPEFQKTLYAVIK